MPFQDLPHDVGSGVAGFEWESEDLAAGGFDFFTAGDEVAPVGAFDEEVGEDFGDELAGGIFVEERDGIDGFEAEGDRGAGVFVQDGPGEAFEALDARVGVQGQDEDVAEGAGCLKQAYMAGMEDVVAAVGKNDFLALLAPLGALGDEVRPGIHCTHPFSLCRRLNSKFMRAVLCLVLLVPIAFAQSLEERITSISKSMQARLVECRRDIHMHPELSNQEVRTGKLIAERLRTLGLDDVKTNIAGNGVTAVLKGGKPGPVVAWRADMDALPIDESSFDVPYKSTVKGVKHACGHDAHTTIGLGIAEALSQVRSELPGSVKFVFQPAEEGVQNAEEWGAKLMIKQGALENPAPAAIYAFHVAPNLPVGKIGYTDNAASSSSASIRISFKGKRAHGAYPYQGIDAVAVASQCILALQTIHSRRIDTLDPSVFTLGTIQGGERRNVIAENVTVAGSVRTLSDKVLDDYETKIKQTLDGCTSAMGAAYTLDYKRFYPAMMNSPALNSAAVPVIEGVLGAKNALQIGPGLFGEDFSFYQRVVPGVMFMLGVGNAAKGITAPVHTANFDLDEDALSIGVNTGARILVDYLIRNAK